MCGRSAFVANIDEVVEHFALEHHPVDIEQRYNIAPGYNGAGAPWIVRVGRDHQREMLTARWWLIPCWWKKPLKELPTAFNARTEDVATKPLFRDAFAKRRCVVPATAWYEFRGARGHKESFAFQLPDHPLFGFAGVWEVWRDPESGERVSSFAIITTTPSELASKFHNRMPVVISPRNYAHWLDPSEHDIAALRHLLQPWSGELKVFQASGFGNNPHHEGPQCLMPLTAATSGASRLANL